MLKIGEFSKLSMLTIKALRFYEKEGLLPPVQVDEWTGYRYYETDQLVTAARSGGWTVTARWPSWCGPRPRSSAG